MSKGAKTKAALKRRAEKRARKDAQRRRYEEYKARGQNKKSSRAQRHTKRETVRSVRHAILFCGNVGCRRCFPRDKQPVAAKKPRFATVHTIYGNAALAAA